VTLLDRPVPAPGEFPEAGIHWVTPKLMAALRIPLLRGRLFDSRDHAGAPRALLINETAARRFWPDADPIGKMVWIPEEGLTSDRFQVVGVIGDVRFGTVETPPAPEFFVSYYQAPLTWRMLFVLRTRDDPMAVAPAAIRTLHEWAPGFPIYQVQPLTNFVSASVAYARVSALLLGMFAVLALALATIGVYGVISFAAAQRTREIGVRVALGATRADVVRLVVGQGVMLVAVGSTIGVVVALAATRALRSVLFGIEPGDPATLAGMVAVLAGTVLLACWIPARRAAGTPAIEALRVG
jgi:putative ABC transport system permease protein